MGTVVIRNLTIKDMQDYYDRSHGGRGTHINRKAIETWNPKIRNGEITLPPEFAAVSYGKVLTWDDVKQRCRERQKELLEQKRSCYGQIQKEPLYVWVFWCPGISGIFEGLWTYIVGLGGDYDGGGYKRQLSGHLLDDVMRLFPVTDQTLFSLKDDWRERERWMEEFIRRYQRGCWCGRPQGKAPVWAEVEGTRIRRIIGRAEWPDEIRRRRRIIRSPKKASNAKEI